MFGGKKVDLLMFQRVFSLNFDVDNEKKKIIQNRSYFNL